MHDERVETGGKKKYVDSLLEVREGARHSIEMLLSSEWRGYYLSTNL
jgi:hypothetical protein